MLLCHLLIFLPLLCGILQFQDKCMPQRKCILQFSVIFSWYVRFPLHVLAVWILDIWRFFASHIPTHSKKPWFIFLQKQCVSLPGETFVAYVYLSKSKLEFYFNYAISSHYFRTRNPWFLSEIYILTSVPSILKVFLIYNSHLHF